MNDLSQTLKAGTLLIIETGEYSDRTWAGPVRLLADASKTELAEAYRNEWTPENKYEDEPTGSGFLPWLVKSGRAEDVADVHSWHVGNWSRFEPE